MTIQLPVLIWTVICFLLLMLILDRLLFRPMLSFMDERKARIDRAAEKAAAEKMLAEAEEKRRNDAIEAEKLLAAEKEDLLAAAASHAKEIVETAQKTKEKRIDAYEAVLADEADSLCAELDRKLGTAADTLVSKIVY